jgi:hypothetical protein
MHPVVDALSCQVVVAARNGCLEIHDPRVRPPGRELLERVTPYIRKVDGTRNAAIRLLGQLHVPLGTADMRLLNAGIARMRKHLIHAPAHHQVAAEEQRETGFDGAYLRWSLSQATVAAVALVSAAGSSKR